MKKLLEASKKQSGWILGTLLTIYAVYQISFKNPQKNKKSKNQKQSDNKNAEKLNQQKDDNSQKNNIYLKKKITDNIKLIEIQQRNEQQSEKQNQSEQQQRKIQENNQSGLFFRKDKKKNIMLNKSFVEDKEKQKDKESLKASLSKSKINFRTKHFEEANNNNGMSEIDEGQVQHILNQSNIKKQKQQKTIRSDNEDNHSNEHLKIQTEIIQEQDRADDFFFMIINEYSKDQNNQRQSQIQLQQ